jgi:hypothetical protein
MKPSQMLVCLFSEILIAMPSHNNPTNGSVVYLLLLGSIDSWYGNKSLVPAHDYKHFVPATMSFG